MAGEWGEITLADSLEFVVDNRGKTVPPAETGIPLIATNCVSNENLYPEHINVRYVTQDTFDTWFRAHPAPGDILLTNKGSKNGAVCLCPDPVGFCIAQDMVALRAKREVIDPLYLFAALRSSVVQYQIKQLNVDSVIPHFKKTDFDKLHIPLPSKKEQERIGQIHFQLCNKIELNRRMNATLEGMAQALFKSWFVDFDPVLDNAILAGNPIPDEFAERAEVRRKILEQNQNDECSVMNDVPSQATRPDAERTGPLNKSSTQNSSFKTHHSPQAHFPAAFEFNDELGWIPEGWETSTIDDECEIVGGGTPSTKNPDFWDDGEFPWVTPKDFSALQDKVLLSSSRFLTQAGLNKVSSGLLPKETVLMSSRAPVGYLAITKIETAINQGFIGMICNKRLSPEFVLQWADSRMDDIKRAAGGSTFAEISKKAFRPFEIVVPNQAALGAYTETAGAIYKRIADGVLASNNLTKLRDTLLPKLISGELRLPEAEQLTEEALA
jgi:type I restriction enzyme S subunit